MARVAQEQGGSGQARLQTFERNAWVRLLRPSVFGHHLHPWIFVLGLVESAILFSAVYVAALIRSAGDLSFIEEVESEFLGDAVAFLIAMLVAMIATGLYQTRQRVHHYGTVLRVGVALAAGTAVLTLIYYVLPDVRVWRGVAALALIYSFFMLVAIRLLFLRVVDQDLFKRRALVFGWGKRAATILELRRRSDQRGFKIVGFVGAPGEEPLVEPAKRIELKERELLQYARANDIDEIVVAMDDRRQGLPSEALIECRLNGIQVCDVLDFLAREAGKVNVRLLWPSYLIFSKGFAQNPVSAASKRALDLVASALLFALMLPVTAFIALAIWLEDGTPILYRQKRVGLHGRQFELYKFRSMCKDAEAASGPQWATAKDCRITRVGAWIRKTRADELPQLINVLRGQMSFVGPRPERPEFVSELVKNIPYYAERHYVKPGITGWAQLCYPYGSSDRDALQKLQYDLFYMKNQSLLFDLMILLQTVEVVLWGKGSR